MIIRMDTRVLMVAEIVLLIISLQSAQGMFREETTKKKSQPQTSANQQAYSSNWNGNQTPRQQSADYSPQASSFTKVEEGASQAAVLSSPADRGFTNSDRSTFSPKSRRSRVKTYRYPSDGKVTTRDPTYTTSVTTKTRPQTRRRYRTRKKGGRRVPNKRRLRKRRRRPGRNSRRRSQQSSGDEISELEEYELEDEPKLAASSTQSRKASSSLSRAGTIAGYSSSKGFGIDGDEIEEGTRLPDDFAGYSMKEQASGSRLHGLKPGNQGQKHTLPLNQRQGPTQSQPVTQSKTTVITSKSTEGTSPRFVQQSNDPGVRDGFTVQKSSSKIPTVPSSRNQGSTIANQPSKVVESSTVIRKQSAGPQESTSTRIQQVPSNTGQVTTRVSQITEGKSFNTHEEKSKAGNSQQSREIERSWVGGKPSDERVFITKQTSASSSASRDKSIKTGAQEKFMEKKQVEVTQDTSPRSTLAGTTTKTTRVSPASRRVQASSTRRKSASARSSRSHQESSRTVIEKKVGAQRSTAQAPKRSQNQEAQRSTAQASRRSQNQQSLTRQSNRRTTDVASSRDQTGNDFSQKTINQQTSPAWVTEVKNQSPRGTVTDEKKVFSGSPQSQDKQSLESISKTVTQTTATRGTADAGSIRGNTPTFTRTEVITYDEQPIVISQSPRVITERTGVPPQKSIVREDVVHKGHWDEWDEEEEEEEEEEDDWLEEHDEEEWLEEYDDEDWLEEDEEWLEEEDCEDDEGDGEHKEEWIEEHWEDYYEDEWEEAEIKRRMEEWEREWEERKYQEWKALFMDSVRERKRREWEEKCRVEKWTEIERERRRKGWEDDWDKVEEVRQKAAWGERWKEMIFEERKKIVDEVHEEEDHHHYKPGVRSEIITTTTTSFITKDGTDSGRVNPSEKVPQSPKPAEKTTTETIITRANTPETSQQGPLGRELDRKDQTKSLDLSRTMNNQITTVKVTDDRQTPSSQGGSNVITVVKAPTSQNERVPDWKSTNKGATITTTSTTTNKDDQPSQSTRNISKQQSSRGARIEPSQQRSQLKNRPGSDSRSKKITNSPRKERKRTVTTVTTTKRTSRPRTSSSRTQKADRSNRAEKPEVQKMSTVTQEPATNKKSSPRRTTKQSSSQTPRNRNNNDPKPLSSRTPTSSSPTTRVPGNRSEAKESQSRQALSRDTTGTGQSPNRLEAQRPSIEPMRGPEKREPGNNSVQKPVPQPMKKDSEKVPTPQKSSMQSPQGTSKTPSREIPHRQQQSTLQDPKSQKPAITQMKTTQETLTSPSKETPQRQQPTSQKPTITQMKSTQKTPNSPTKETPQNQQPTSKEPNSQKPTIIQMKTTQQTSTPASKSMPQKELSEQKDSTPQKAPIVPLKTIQESSTPASKTTLEKGQPKSEDSTPQKAPIVPMKTIQESSTPAPKTTIEKGQPKSDNSTPQKASIVPTQTTQEPTTPASKSTPQKEQLEKKESIPQKAPIVPMKTNQESSTPAPKSTSQKEQPKLEDSTHQKVPIVPMKTTQESSTPAPKTTPQKEPLAVKDPAPQKDPSSPIDPIKTTKELSTPAPKSTPQKEQSKLEDSTHQKAPIVPTKTTQGPSTPAPKSTPQKEQSQQKDPTPQKVPIVPMKTTQESSTPAPKSTVQIEQPKEKDSMPQKASSPLIDPMKTTQKPSSPDSKTTPQKEQLTVRDPTPQKNPNVPMQTTKGSSTSSPKETPQQPSSEPKDKTPQHLSITPMKTTQGTSTTSKQNQQQHQPTTKETIPKTPSITPTKIKSPENVVGPEKASSSRLRHEQNRKSGILTQQKPVLTSKTPSISQATRKDSASEKILVKPMKHDSGPIQPSSRTTSKIQRTDTLKSQKPSIVRGKQISESSQSPQTFITKTKAVREPGNDWGSIEQKSVKVVSARRGSGRTEGQDVFLKKNIQNSSISRQKQIEAEGINASRSSSRSRVTQYSAQKKDRSLKKVESNYSRGSQVSGGMGKAQGDSTLRTSQSSRATRKRIMHYPGSRSSLKANDLSFTKSSDVVKDQALRKSFRRGGSRGRIRNKQSSLIRPELSSQDVGRISSRRHEGFSSAESQADLFRKLLARDSSSRRSYQDVSSGYSSNYFLDDDDEDGLYDNLYPSQHTSHPSDSFALKSHSNIQPKWGALRRNYMNHFSPSEYNQYLDYDDEETDYDDLYSYHLGGANDYQNHPAYLDKYWSPTYGSRQRKDVNYEWTSPRFSDYELDDELEPEGPYSLRNYPDYSYYDSKSGLRQRNDLNILTDSSENGLDFFPFGGKSFFRSPYPYIYSNLWGNNKLFVNGLPRYNVLEYEDPNKLENSFFGSIYTPYSHHNPLYNNLWRGNQLFVDYSPTYNILDNYDPFILKDSISGSIYSPYSNHYPFYNNLWGDNKLSVNGFPRYNILEDFDSNNLQNPFSGSILSPYSHNNPLYNDLWGDNKLFVNGFPSYNILEDYDSNNLENSFSGSILSPYSHNNPFYNNLWGDNKLFVNGFPSYNILEDYDSNNLENLISGSMYSPYTNHHPFYNNLWRGNPHFVDDFSKYNLLDYYDPNNPENEGLVDITNGRWGTPWYFAKFSGTKRFPYRKFQSYKKLTSGYPSYNPPPPYSKFGFNNIFSIHSPSVNPYSAESRDKYHSLLALISGRNDRTYSQVGRLNDRVRRGRTNRIFGEGSLYDKSIDLTQIQDIPVTRSAFIRGNNGKLGKIINYDSDYFCGRRDPPLAISMLCGNPCFPKCLETY